MSVNRNNKTGVPAAKYVLAVVICFFIPTIMYAQAERPLTWLQDITALESAASSRSPEQHTTVIQIRAEVDNWLKLHPDSKIKLPPAPEEPWTAEQTQSQIAVLRQTVEQILKQDPDRPFHLGVEEVNVTAAMSPLSPVADSISQTEIKLRDAGNLSQAITYLPGVSLDHYSSRNQVGIYLRGFDTREVPLYVDGIPIYVPYDGQIDYNRFLTGEISEVQIAKGYSSALMGPNAMGGAVNLVTKQPVNKLEGEASIGSHSGGGLDSGLHFGSRWRRFFVQGSLDWTQSNYIPLSHDFQVNSYQPTYARVNSYNRDERYSGRLGWTPRGQDEYVFSYINQKANYGDPSYAGIYPVCASGQSDAAGNRCDNAKYWKWPVWNKQSYYFLSSTGIGETGSLKLRAYYDHYPTQTNEYDNQTYSSMTSATKTGIVNYDDHTDGASAEFTSRILPRNVIGTSLFFKDDTHKEGGYSGSASMVNLSMHSPVILAGGNGSGGGNGGGTGGGTGGGSGSSGGLQPWRVDRDQIWSWGLEDTVTISSRLRATAGFSVDHQRGLQAQNFNLSTKEVIPFTCQLYPNGATYSDCTAYFWTFNPAVAVSYSLTTSDSLYATFSDKSRFAMIKERYSGRFGQALPNPDLGPERAKNWTFGYSHAFASRTVAQIDFFRSDVKDAIENATVDVTGTDYESQCQTPTACKVFVNVGKEVRQGVELTVRSTPLSWLTLDANYSFLNRSLPSIPAAISINGLPASIPTVYLTGTPKHKAVGTATVRLPRQILFLASARYEAGTYYQLDGSSLAPSVAPPFATVDLGGVVPFGSKLSLQLGVKNLFDRLYCYQEGYPAVGRNWSANMRYRF